MVGSDRMGDVLEENGFTRARRRDDQTTLAFAQRRHKVHHAWRKIFRGRDFEFHLEPLIGVERRQIVEMHLVADLLRVLEIDRVDLEQCEIAFAFLGSTDRPFHSIACFQRETADLRGRDVDIVRAREVIGVGRAQEAKAILQKLDNAFTDDFHILCGQHLQDREHQFLLAHDAGVFDLNRLGESQKVGRGFVLEVLKLHFGHEEGHTLARRTGRVGVVSEGAAGGAPL